MRARACLPPGPDHQETSSHLREIVANAGDESSVTVNRVVEGCGALGHDAALIAGLVISTEAMGAEAPKQDEPAMGGMDS